MQLLQPTIDQLAEKINWSFFFAAWGVPGTFPAVFRHPEKGAEARRLYDDARRMLDRIAADDSLHPRGIMRTFPARKEGNIMVLTADDGTEHSFTFPVDGQGNCVTDFLESSGGKVTLFVFSGAFGLEELCARFRDKGDDYNAFMAKFLADRLAEAFAELYLPRGKRIGIGYPAAPDHTMKRQILALLDPASQAGFALTTTCMLIPSESIIGFHFTQKFTI